MEDTDKKDIEKMIDDSVRESFKKRVGDTPTDALQLVNKKYCDSRGAAYGGQIAAANASSTLPEGWTASVTGDATIQVVHNLGTTDYGVAVSAQRGSVFGTNIPVQIHDGEIRENSFEYITYVPGTGGVDVPVTFTLNKNG